jgi:hypothetical protein
MVARALVGANAQRRTRRRVAIFTPPDPRVGLRDVRL